MVHNTHNVLKLLTRKNNRSLIVERKQYNTGIFFWRFLNQERKKEKKKEKKDVYMYIFIYIYIWEGRGIKHINHTVNYNGL